MLVMTMIRWDRQIYLGVVLLGAGARCGAHG